MICPSDRAARRAAKVKMAMRLPLQRNVKFSPRPQELHP